MERNSILTVVGGAVASIGLVVVFGGLRALRRRCWRGAGWCPKCLLGRCRPEFCRIAFHVSKHLS